MRATDRVIVIKQLIKKARNMACEPIALDLEFLLKHEEQNEVKELEREFLETFTQLKAIHKRLNEIKK